MAGKQVRAEFSNDRISNLPSDIIDCILTHLPLLDATKTSILSTHWRYKWKTIPYLVFLPNFSVSLPRICDFDYPIYHILVTHKAPIAKFSLDTSRTIKNNALDHWLRILSKYPHFEALELKFSNQIPPLITHYLFSCQQLTHLSLKNVLIHFPDTFKGFNRLVSLHLDNIVGIYKVLEMFTSKCPMLEQLYLNSTVTTSLSISAPNLKSFQFHGVFTSICFETESLEDIKIGNYLFCPISRKKLLSKFKSGDSSGNKKDMAEVFSQLPSIRRVELHNCFLQFLAIGSVPQRLPNGLNRLTVLKIHGLCLEWNKELNVTLCLIRSSPNLQFFEISLDTYGKDKVVALTSLKACQDCQDPLSCSLKTIKIEKFDGRDGPQMEFLKFMLLGATGLEKLKIRSRYVDKIVTRVTSLLPRASPKAKIVFVRLH